jgi:hypothetical protein
MKKLSKSLLADSYRSEANEQPSSVQPIPNPDTIAPASKDIHQVKLFTRAGATGAQSCPPSPLKNPFILSRFKKEAATSLPARFDKSAAFVPFVVVITNSFPKIIFLQRANWGVCQIESLYLHRSSLSSMKHLAIPLSALQSLLDRFHRNHLFCAK